MKAVVVTVKNAREWDVKEFNDVNEMKKYYVHSGYTADYTELRKAGAIVHRAELDNQPTFKGLCGPMWDGGMLRYEGWDVYEMLSN